jgi:hypothetical protein
MIAKIFLSCFLFAALLGNQTEVVGPTHPEISLKNVLKNGKHYANIGFFNAGTGHRTSYNGEVTVRDDIVIAIDLPKKGPILI